MSNGYKVRLGDGSEIGPMDLATLRGWYVQGLINQNSPVMVPGSSRWITLGETSEIRGFKGGFAGAGPATPSQRPAPRPAPSQPRPPVGPRKRPAPAEPFARKTPWGAVLVLIVLAVGGGAAYLFLGPSPEEKQIRGWAQAESRVVDAATGLTLDAPSPWVVLRKEQNFVSAPDDAKAVLAHPRKGAFAYLVAERASTTADALLDEIVGGRKAAVTGLTESGRSDATVGKRALKQSLTAFESGGKRFQGVTLAGQEGGTAFALVGWEPAGAPGEVLRLAEGLTVVPPKVAGLDEAIQVSAREVPFLTATAAKAVMAQSAAQVLEPDETFRRSLQYMGMGLGSLSPKEQRELGDLNRTVYGAVPQKERWRMAAYIDRVRNRSTTAAEDNKRYRELMRDAVQKLPAPKRARLQQLYEQAILKGLGMG